MSVKDGGGGYVREMSEGAKTDTEIYMQQKKKDVYRGLRKIDVPLVGSG